MGLTRTWSIVDGRQLVECEGTPFVDASDLDAHETDTTGVHGISDFSALVASPDIDTVDVVTQAAYDLLSPPNSRTLYVIVG